MAAMQKSSKEEKMSELKAVAEKLPAPNLLLLKRLLSLLQHIGHNAATSRMTCSNLAICVGPNLLSPPNEELLPLQAMLEVAEKVKVLVEFMVENCRELLGEETRELSSPAGEESPAPTERCGHLRLEEQSGPALTADTEHWAEALLHAPPSPLGGLQEGGGDTVAESETGEAPPALPPTAPEGAADSLGRPEEPASLAEDRSFAGSPQDKEKKRSRKRKQAWGEESESRAQKKSRKRENVFGAGPVKRCRKVQQVRKARRGTTLRPQLRLALEQLWVLSGGKEAAGKEEEQGSHEDSTSLLFVWPTGSCVATFGSRALKELWLGTLLGTAEGGKRARVTRLPSLTLLEKELRRRHAWRTFSTRSLERLMEGQAEADPKQGLPTVPSSSGGGLCRSAGGNGRRRRRRGLSWPFALWRSPATAQAPGQSGSGCSRPLFGQPLAALCGEDGTLPRPIQELLAVLQQEGPSTEGIFRRADSGTAVRELREALDCGADVDLGSQPALLLAVILKDFLRSIPSKLLVNNLYEDWMAAMQKSSKEEKMSELKAVAEKLPAPNLLLLKRLLSLLQHIGHNAATSRLTCSNLAICVGPNLLSPPNEELLPLQAMLEVAEKVKVLVEFMVENCRELLGEETRELSSPAGEESPAPTERCGHLRLEEQSGPALTADTEHWAEALLHAPPSPLGGLQEGGGDTVAESETGEAPPALPPTAPEGAADSLGRPEEPASLAEDRSFAGSPQDKEKKRSRKRKQAWGEESESRAQKKSRKRENVFGAGPVKRCRKVQQVRKARRGTTLRPQLRLALEQLWVLSGGKEAAGKEEEQGSHEDSTSLLFVWPTGSCVATFGSRALKELWLGTLLGTAEGGKRARVTRLPSLTLLEKELRRRHAWRTFSTRSLERLMEGQAEADPKQGLPTVPSSSGGGLCRSAGEFWKERQAPASA
ncbi:uncharacterized protein LJ206_006625 [Theristicus caerulescens]